MIKLILSAPVPEIAKAFEQHFSDDENVEIISKPFQAIPDFECMVSAANSFGLMDMGAGCGQVSPDSVAAQMKSVWRSIVNRSSYINWQYALGRQHAVHSSCNGVL